MRIAPLPGAAAAASWFLTTRFEETMRRKDKTVILYARSPVRGKVKTRLAAETSPDTALQVYTALLDATIATISQYADAYRIVVDAAAPEDVFPLQQRATCAHAVRAQAGQNLGSRMLHSFRRAFSEGSTGVLLIGSDVPGFTGDLIVEGLHRLENHDVVLGPSADGGYYLIGMNHPYAELFRSIPWSSASVLAETVRQADTLGCSVVRLVTLHDIDTRDDLCRWIADHPAHELTRALAPAMEAVISAR